MSGMTRLTLLVVFVCVDGFVIAPRIARASGARSTALLATKPTPIDFFGRQPSPSGSPFSEPTPLGSVFGGIETFLLPPLANTSTLLDPRQDETDAADAVDAIFRRGTAPGPSARDDLAPSLVGGPRKGPSEFEVNLGRSIDVLRQTFPVYLEEEPQWDIYTDALETRDPSGIAIRGLRGFQRFHGTLRAVRNVLAAPGFDGAAITFRLTYDWAGQRVRVQWYSRWRARGAPLSAPRLHVDGVSIFDINDQGRVYRHTVERVLINGVNAEPPFFGMNMQQMLQMPMPQPVAVGA